MDKATSSEVLVENVLTDQGWRRLHFICGGEGALEKAKAEWLIKVPWESEDAIHTLTYEEAGIWHCLMLWPLRGEVVKVEPINPEISEGKIVLWTLTGKGERVSRAIEKAAWRYYVLFDSLPDTAWVGERLDQYDGRDLTVGEMEIGIRFARWMPRSGVAVGLLGTGES